MATSLMTPAKTSPPVSESLYQYFLGHEPTRQATMWRRIRRMLAPAYGVSVLLFWLLPAALADQPELSGLVGAVVTIALMLLVSLVNFLTFKPIAVDNAADDYRFRHRALLAIVSLTSGFGVIYLVTLLTGQAGIGSPAGILAFLVFLLVVWALSRNQYSLAGLLYCVYLTVLMVIGLVTGTLANIDAGEQVSVWSYVQTSVVNLFTVMFIATLLIDSLRFQILFMTLTGMLYFVLYPLYLTNYGIELSVIVPEVLTTLIYIIGATTLGVYVNTEIMRYRVRLQKLVATLEDRVSERTHEIEQSARLSAELAELREPQAVYQAIVEGTRKTLNHYHVGLYLLDEATGLLQYRAGSQSVPADTPPDAGRQFTLEDKGLVPAAAGKRQMMLVNDVKTSPDWVADPHLPMTASQASAPLIVQDRLIGVLDLHSDKPGAFDEDAARVIQLLSSNIAIVIENTRQYAQQVAVAEHLRQVDTLKSQFLASMSHELRTPLNAILNFTEFAVRGLLGPITDRTRDALQKSLDSGRHLLALINDVLDIAKIEAGKMQLFVEDNINPNEELKQVQALAESLIGDRPIQLNTDIDADLPLMLGDRRRIRQILMNLVSNAAKFTQEGSITLAAKNLNGEIMFAVIDTGPGIPESDHERIFRPFEQTETGVRHVSGTGLGLPISARLAEAHGGRIDLMSTPGEGAGFFVHLPVRPEHLRAQMMGETVNHDL
ncbi:MAG: GAF domain-containing protein [Pleurocapsa minor GSE-CHR-MK-17-07R]|jgi:signal transduction histidine kinase|nr:GAF domain-containing protein [Pleurocapsa minor GSE-CHR-MK 17-07R]